MQICMSCERRLRIWYDLRLLSGDRPLPIATLTQRLHNLGQKLGDGHGLATLFACRYPLPDARIEGRLKKQTIYVARDFSTLHLASKVGVIYHRKAVDLIFLHNSLDRFRID